MAVGMLGLKIGMSRLFTKDGTSVPVTVIKIPVNYVVQVKDRSKDGYSAIQVGAFEAKEKHVTKPMAGHFNKRGVKLLRRLKEFRVEDNETFTEGAELKIEEIFQKGDLVDVTGISKGRGFTGTMKRWDFSGFPRSHGHRYHRAVGAIGNRTDPGRVWKGKKMAGHYGSEKVTVQALVVFDVIPEQGLLVVKGSVPGPNGGVVAVEKSRISSRKNKRLKQARVKELTENVITSGDDS